MYIGVGLGLQGPINLNRFVETITADVERVRYPG